MRIKRKIVLKIVIALCAISAVTYYSLHYYFDYKIKFLIDEIRVANIENKYSHEKKISEENIQLLKTLRKICEDKDSNGKSLQECFWEITAPFNSYTQEKATDMEIKEAYEKLEVFNKQPEIKQIFELCDEIVKKNYSFTDNSKGQYNTSTFLIHQHLRKFQILLKCYNNSNFDTLLNKYKAMKNAMEKNPISKLFSGNINMRRSISKLLKTNRIDSSQAEKIISRLELKKIENEEFYCYYYFTLGHSILHYENNELWEQLKRDDDYNIQTVGFKNISKFLISAISLTRTNPFSIKRSNSEEKYIINHKPYGLFYKNDLINYLSRSKAIKNEYEKYQSGKSINFENIKQRPFYFLDIFRDTYGINTEDAFDNFIFQKINIANLELALYKKKNGKYPEKLDANNPVFISPITNKVFKYNPEDEGIKRGQVSFKDTDNKSFVEFLQTTIIFIYFAIVIISIIFYIAFPIYIMRKIKAYRLAKKSRSQNDS